MAQAQISGYELNLEEYWQVIVRRRGVIIFCAVAMAVFSWLFTWMNQPPPLYKSDAAVKIERSTNLADVLLRGSSFSPVDEMNTQLALVTSYALMELVAKRLGLIPSELTTEDIRENPDYMEKILDLKDAVTAEQENDSGVIVITATWSSPEFARDLAQTVADAFRDYNIEEKNKRVFEAKRFIKSQLVVVGERLRRAEEAVRAYKKAHHLSMVGDSSDVMAKVVSDLEQEYRREVAHLSDIRFALAQLRQRVQHGGWDYKAVSVAGKVSEYFDQLNKRLVDLALKHTELATHFTDQHPQIQELRAQANDILASMVDELEKQVKISQESMQAIQKAIEENQRRYQGLPEEALELQRLERSVRINEDLYGLLEKKYQEVLIREAEKVEDVTLLRPALLSPVRINPVRTAQTAVAGLILGLVLGLIIALILESLDSSVGTIEEVESFLEVPVVGFIPHLSQEEAMELFSGTEGLATSGHELQRQIRLVTHFAPPSTIAESYRSLRTNLMFSQAGQHRVLMVSSATVKEGKSTVAANLAVVVAQQGARVLLIDADMRKPLQHHTFGVPRAPGLGECLLGQINWQDAIRHFSDVMLGEMGVDQALLTPGLDQLDLLTCGSVVANPTDLLAGSMMRQILEEIRQEYDMVILDMPPLLHASDATVMAPHVDGVLLVYHIGAVVRGALKRVKNSIEAVGGQVIGVVLNGVRGEVSPDYARYKMDRYYAYSYGEKSREKKSWPERISDEFRALGRELSVRFGRKKGGNGPGAA